jgi:hypothetical protein
VQLVARTLTNCKVPGSSFKQRALCAIRRLPLEARDPAHNKIIFHEDVGAGCIRLAAEIDATISLVVTISPA